MDRIELVKTLLLKRNISSRSLRNFLNTKYEYIPGHPLYMRETHFIAAVGENGSTGLEIAEQMHVSLGSVSQTANQLEAKGCITRMKSKEDKRQTIFYLTELGKQIQTAHAAYDEDAYQMISQLLSEYSDDELKCFIEYEEKIAAVYLRK